MNTAILFQGFLLVVLRAVGTGSTGAASPGQYGNDIYDTSKPFSNRRSSSSPLGGLSSDGCDDNDTAADDDEDLAIHICVTPEQLTLMHMLQVVAEDEQVKVLIWLCCMARYDVET